MWRRILCVHILPPHYLPPVFSIHAFEVFHHILSMCVTSLFHNIYTYILLSVVNALVFVQAHFQVYIYIYTFCLFDCRQEFCAIYNARSIRNRHFQIITSYVCVCMNVCFDENYNDDRADFNRSKLALRENNVIKCTYRGKH